MPTPDPVERAQQAVADQPNDLDRHLKLLEVYSSHERLPEFTSALEAMYKQVEHDEQPQWQKALALAANTAPDHPLVLGSMDWDPDPEPADEQSGTGAPVLESEILDQPEDDLDDLRGLLTEAENSEMAAASAPLEDVEPEADSDAPTEPEMTAMQSTEATSDELDTPFLHEDDRDGDWESGVEATPIALDDQVETEDFLAERLRDDEADRESADTTPLSLDWPEASEGDAVADESSAESAPAPSVSDSSLHEEDDIFSASDDDVDVKLDLARAYLSWNSIDSARTLLEEVVVEGNSQQREQAKTLLDDIE